MTALPKDIQSHQTDALLVGLTCVCREIGAMIAQLETSLIDASQLAGEMTLPRRPLQQIDMVMQSVEEMALIIERFQGGLPPDIVVDLQAVVDPIRLEWMRRHLAADPKQDDGVLRRSDQGNVSLF